MEALLIATLGALAVKGLDFVKFLLNKDWNAVITQAAAWLSGIVVLWVASAASVFDAVTVPGVGVPIGSLDAGSLVFIGLNLASVLGIVYDYKKAIDGSDSAKTPPLTGTPSK
jgi:hypothetical protein